ncbi:MAG: hypothetical protein H7Z71_05260 [Moraxellaceae bacterium]|nr:hypothetical protein [Pseudobdellovibrionaceae bacterium]
MSVLGILENHKIQKRPVVLIIDDDVDAVISLERTVQNLGCDTVTALDAADAQKKLMAGKIDLVILDWHLDSNIEAGEILEKVTRTLKKFSRVNNRLNEDQQQGPKKTFLVTHSSLKESEIVVPESDYFKSLGHWQKPVDRNDLVKKTSDVLKSIGF